MTHDRCSELLRAYVRGELPREAAEEVRAHLATCGECRAEERAVTAVAGTEAAGVLPLDDMERARLHRGLAQELFTPRANADVAGAGSPERSWARWVVPAATAAAVLAGLFVMTLGGGMDEAAETATEFGGADAGGAGRVEDSAEGSEPADEDKPEEERSSAALSGQAGGSAEANYAGPEQPQPAFDPDRGDIDAAELSEIGGGRLFRSFAGAYRPEEGPGLYDGFLKTLVEEAGGAGLQIEECAATLPQDGSLVPAYATAGEYDGRRALVLGFVTSDPGSPRFDRYVMWVWELGECEQPIDTLFERID